MRLFIHSFLINMKSLTIEAALDCVMSTRVLGIYLTSRYEMNLV